jgi:hypothetical protein
MSAINSEPKPASSFELRGTEVLICISCCSRMSRAFAELLSAWLRDFFPGVTVEIVAEDFQSGPGVGAWIKRLQVARVSVMCVTTDVITQPWSYFLLGLMLRHTGARGMVAPIFLDVAPEDVSPTPLHMLQATCLKRADFSLFAQQVEELVAPNADPADSAQRFVDSWPGLLDRSRRIPGATLDPFLFSIALPQRVIWFRYDPSGKDGDWQEAVAKLLPALATGPLDLGDIELGYYDCLDVDGERWVQPPAVISRVGTSHIALVHPQFVESHGGSARGSAHAIRGAVDPSKAGLKVMPWQDDFVVGTEVM